MIIDAYATDTVPSYEVRRRALEALTNEGEPMSEVTYDALRKRLAQAETEIEKLRAALEEIKSLAWVKPKDFEYRRVSLFAQIAQIAQVALGETP